MVIKKISDFIVEKYNFILHYFYSVSLNLFKEASDFVEKYMYIIPAVMGVVVFLGACYLMYEAVNAMSEANNAIKAIPNIIQSEMAKTRTVMRDEGDTSRKVMEGEHALTREELLGKLEIIENQRNEIRSELKFIQKNTTPFLPVGPTKPQNHKKVLGIF